MNKIKYIVMDVDGTMTDGKIYMGNDGEVMKAFDIKDGYAISRIMPQNNIIPIVITGRKSQIVENRCRELGVDELCQGCLDKKERLLDIAKKYGADIKDGIIKGFAFIGDDILDIPAMEISEYSACPADASEEVMKIVDYTCRRKGGDGAIREYIDWLLKNELKYS